MMPICPNCGRDPKQTTDKLFKEWYASGIHTCPSCIRKILGPKPGAMKKPRCPVCSGPTGAAGVTCAKCQARGYRPQELFPEEGETE